jgi:hypothetical protein
VSKTNLSKGKFFAASNELIKDNLFIQTDLSKTFSIKYITVPDPNADTTDLKTGRIAFKKEPLPTFLLIR